MKKKKIAIISHGKIFHDCTSAFNKNKYLLINLFKSKPFPEKLVKKIRTIEKFLVVDEQTPSGNLSSCVYEGFRDKKFYPKIVSKSLPERYFLKMGKRISLNKFGLSKTDLLKATKDF